LLEVKSIWRICMLKEGDGFQQWHQDLACNGQILYTIVVILGSKKILAYVEEIDIDKIAYGVDVQLTNDTDNSIGNYEDVKKEDYSNKGKRNHPPKDLMEEDQRKYQPKDIPVSVTVSTISMTMTRSTRLILILRTSFGLPFQGTAVVKTSFLEGPRNRTHVT
jgi:hypothetical protein